ncbi:hypothetical protein HDV00_008518 [Rhizophlyctis rosea]|nr:hypothetical protein HDV00_008518 [Rhizophlyctis rosea]
MTIPTTPTTYPNINYDLIRQLKERNFDDAKITLAINAVHQKFAQTVLNGASDSELLAGVREVIHCHAVAEHMRLYEADEKRKAQERRLAYVLKVVELQQADLCKVLQSTEEIERQADQLQNFTAMLDTMKYDLARLMVGRRKGEGQRERGREEVVWGKRAGAQGRGKVDYQHLDSPTNTY